MKVALITDTHWGIRNDAQPFLDMSKTFINDVFLKTLYDRNITQVVHLGDLLDRRKYVNFATAQKLYTDFIGPVTCMVDRFDLILGNHDVFHKNTNYLAGPVELYRHMRSDEFRIYYDAAEAMLGDLPALYVPWINDENREHTLQMIEQTKAQVCFGHLELEGFEMYRGVECVEGMSPSLFSKFDVTCSGHFHHKSSKNGIHFLGSHGEFTWADYNDERGFHIFDTETRELEFIQNPYTMFEKVFYRGDDTPQEYTTADLGGKYVKIIVSQRGDQVAFEQFISAIESCNPVEVQVVDDHLNAGDVADALEIDETEDTLSIFRKVTEFYEGDRAQMDSFITELYQEALATE